MSARTDILEWAARVGAVSAEALVVREGCSPASARSRLAAAERGGLLAGTRPLVDEPRLYALTAQGYRAVSIAGRPPVRIGTSSARHSAACAHVAAVIESAYPDLSVSGEADLRARERAHGRPLASAALAGVRPAGQAVHRPDLVLWPASPLIGLPVAIEVELTVKSPRRLQAICAAWARARCVSGVIYLASTQANEPVARAISGARAQRRVALVAVGPFLDGTVAAGAPLERTVAVGA